MQISLRPFRAETDSAQAARLYESAFPPCERRDTALWLRMLGEGGRMQGLIVEQEGTFAGFITMWPLNRFTYVEHFAVDPARRGLGIGHEVLQQVLRKAHPAPVVLEVEPPATGKMARRRITFYRRSGLVLCRKPYMQPPYHAGENPFELRLMCNRARFLNTHFEEVRRAIHRNVYGVTC